jgi:hypothetical protein
MPCPPPRPQRIVEANGEPVKADYITHRKGKGWLISDIDLDGASSDVASLRSKLAVIIRPTVSTV